MLFTLLEDCHFSMNLNINLQREFICSPKNDKNALNKLMKEANVNEATVNIPVFCNIFGVSKPPFICWKWNWWNQLYYLKMLNWANNYDE